MEEKNNALLEALDLHKQTIEEENKDKDNNKKENSFMEDFFNTTLDDYDEFDTKAWKKGEGYELPNFKDMEEKLEGLDAGLYLFAGESNSGKTGTMMNIMFDACSCKKNKLFGIYYSLDDSKQEIIPRVIAMNEQIPIGIAAKPQRYKNILEQSDEGSFLIQEQLEKRNNGIKFLKSMNKHFKVTDSNKIKCAEDVYEHMKAAYTYIKAYDKDYNLIIAIDSMNDIRFKDRRLAPGEELNSEIARVVKEWTVEFNIPILGSCHLRKLNANRRPVLDDLKNSIEYIYESSVVFLVYNDISKNNQAANIFYNIEGVDDKQPILELDWAKNKKSSYKGRTYYAFIPEQSRIREISEEDSRRFDALIYEN